MAAGERGVVVVTGARSGSGFPRGEAYRRVFQTLRAMIELEPGRHTFAEISDRLPEISRPVLSRILAIGSESRFFIGRHERGVYELEHSPVRHVEHGYGHGWSGPVSPSARSALLTLQEATGSLVQLHGVYMLAAPLRMCAGTETGGDPALDALVDEYGPANRGPQSLLLGAAGHAMLGSLPSDVADQILADPPRGAFGGLWREPLTEEVGQIVDRGYAHAVSPDGWETIAAPMPSATLVSPALSLTFPAGASDGQREARIRRLQSSAPFIQELLDDAGRRALLAAST